MTTQQPRLDVDRRALETAAGEVLEAHRIPMNAPVDPYVLARLERIRLLPGNYDGCFDGRIECRGAGAQAKFYLLYEPRGPRRPEGKVRFSVAHELAHFFLPSHRDFLVSGVWHGSRADFVSDKPTEREADYFASALLMPEARFTMEVRKKSGGICDLANLIDLADRIFATSIISTVIRYTHLNFEACSIVLSRARKTLYAVSSEDMWSIGMGWFERGGRVPELSVTARALKGPPVDPLGGRPNLVRGSVESDVWHPGKQSRSMWEEVHRFGGDLALTLLTVDDNEDYDADRDF